MFKQREINSFDEVPNEEYIWRTNVPSFSMERLKVVERKEKDNSIILVVKDSDIYNNEIIFKPLPRGGYYAKQCFHFSEYEAAKRLKSILPSLYDKNSKAVYKNVITQSMLDDFFERFPEMNLVYMGLTYE